jgi:hypothetical protein
MSADEEDGLIADDGLFPTGCYANALSIAIMGELALAPSYDKHISTWRRPTGVLREGKWGNIFSQALAGPQTRAAWRLFLLIALVGFQPPPSSQFYSEPQFFHKNCGRDKGKKKQDGNDLDLWIKHSFYYYTSNSHDYSPPWAVTNQAMITQEISDYQGRNRT